MIENYEWRDLRNAVGWAAACARLALPFYDGDHRDDVVAAIEVAERYTRGEEIAASDDAYNCAHAAYRVAQTGAFGDTASTLTAAYAADAVAYVTSKTKHVIQAAVHAVRAGVPQSIVDQTQFAAIASDLGPEPESDAWFAAVAALAIGNIELAQEIAGL